MPKKSAATPPAPALEKPEPPPHASPPPKKAPAHAHIAIESTRRNASGQAVHTKTCISCGDHL